MCDENKIIKSLPPLQCIQNFPYVDESINAINDWQLLQKVWAKCNEVVDLSNLTQKQQQDLYNYVTNYFNNLDVQEEINNKLNEMAQSGELTSLITSFLETNATINFNVVNDMLASTVLKNGSFAKTQGYHSINDGGDCFYKIYDTKQSNYDIELQSGLFASPIHGKVINVLKFGVDNTGAKYVSDLINSLLTDFKGYELYFPNGDYKLDKVLYIDANTTITGEHRYNTRFFSDLAINYFELKNSFSSKITLNNFYLDGNYVALKGIYLHKTEYSLETVDMGINLTNLFFRRFTDWCCQIGGESTEYVLADNYCNNLKFEQFQNGALLITNRCTDSFFNNIRAGGSNISNRENIVVRGYNLHFKNCKSFYSGTDTNFKDGWLFDGCSCIDADIEAQDCSRYGVNITNSHNCNFNLLLDKNSNANSDYPALYINNSQFLIINAYVSNYEQSQNYLTKRACQFVNSSYININIVTATNVPKIFDQILTDNSYNINYSINGYENIDITPNFDNIDYNENGIIVKTIGNNKLLVQGTPTQDVSIPLKGSFGGSDIITIIPENYLLKSFISNKFDDKISLQVFYDKTSTLVSNNNNKIISANSNYNVNGLNLKIASGISYNKIITPKLFITKNTNEVL